jgi:hypothetical protein
MRADVIILYGGGTKKRQPQDIANAKVLHGEYRARKAEAIMATEKKAQPPQRRRKKR